MDKRSRKCDTAAYRKRRKREAVSHRESMERKRVAEAERHQLIRIAQEKHREEQQARRQLGQRTVNVLSVRLCSQDPGYAARLRVRDLFRITNLFTSGELGVDDFMYLTPDRLLADIADARERVL